MSNLTDKIILGAVVLELMDNGYKVELEGPDDTHSYLLIRSTR